MKTHFENINKKLTRFLGFLGLLLSYHQLVVAYDKTTPNNYNETYVFKQFNTFNSDLGSNTVYRVLQDRHNYLWFFTDKGLYKYNGASFLHLKKTANMDIINNIVDSNGHFWLFNYDGSIKVFDPLSHNIKALDSALNINIQHLSSIPFVVGYIDDTLTYLGKSSQDVKECLIVNTKTQSIISSTHFNQFLLQIYQAFSLSSQEDVPIAEGPNYYSNLNFIITENSKYLLRNGKIFKKNPSKKELVFDGWQYNIKKNLISLAINKKDLYLAVWDVGILRFNNYFSTQATRTVTIDTLLREDRVTKIFFDKDDNLWATTQGSGIFLHKREFSQLKNIHFPNIKNEHNHAKKMMLYDDQVFVSVGGGKSLYKLNTSLFETEKYTSNVEVIDHTITQKIGAHQLAINYANIYSLNKSGNNLIFKEVCEKCKGLKIKDFVYTKDKAYFTITPGVRYIDSNLSLHENRKVPERRITSIAPINDSQLFIGTSYGLLLNNTPIGSIGSETILKCRVYDGVAYISTQSGVYKYAQAQNTSVKPLKMSNHTAKDIQSDDAYLYINNDVYFSILVKNTSEEIFRINASELPIPEAIKQVLIAPKSIYLVTSTHLYTIDKAFVSLAKQQTPTINIYANNQYIDSIAKLPPLTKKNLELMFDVIDFSSNAYTIDFSFWHDNELMIQQKGEQLKNNTYIYNLLISKPGTYEFDVTLKDNANNTYHTRHKILVIEEEWWQTVWFKILIGILSVILLSGVVLYINRYYRRAYVQKLNEEVKVFELETKNTLSQLKPHFIFNALTPLQYFLYKGDSQGGLKYIQSLSLLIRQLLNNIREKHILIEKEIQFLESYFIVQSIRFQNCFTYNIRVAADIQPSNVLIPTMILQPIVENALEHGIDKELNDGVINIAFTIKNDQLQIEISDNGDGLPEDFKPKPNHAIAIIQEHIELIHKRMGIGKFEYCNLPKGSLFRITLPLQKSYI